VTIAAQSRAGELCLSGWWFDVASGDMYTYYDGESRLFEIIDGQTAERLIARVGRVSNADGV
jgi:carbonic anhydrase